MPRYIAFLRAINVGGHFVKMDALRELFGALDFANVETFIASGNVIFEAKSKTPHTLERKIEAHLENALGYAVATFIRTPAELTMIANHKAFAPSLLANAAALNIAFLSAPPDDASVQKLMTKRTAIDEFAVNEREVYWLCRKNQSKSKFSNAVLERTLGCASTLRGFETVRKMADKYGEP